MVSRDGATVTLSHGSGAPIGQVTVASMHTVPEALAEVEGLVRASGYPLGDTDLRLALLDGVTWGLDRYTRVLYGDRLASFKVRLKGVTVGIGATVRRTDQRLVITQLVEEGPAAVGGVKVGDVLLRVDGRSTVNMGSADVVALLRGADGTQVTVRVLRGTEERELVLTRAEVVVPNVEHRVLEGGVGYVKVTHVSQRTTDNLAAALADLRSQGALDRGLVLDLRGNTGGSMKEAARSADAFLTDGLLLRTVGPDGGRVQNLQARMEAVDTDDEPAVPVILVVDDRTASGAEIVAGALLELDRAALVGTRTYGKGTVQKTYTLDDDAQLKLTVAQYLLANGRVIADQGLVPDVLLGAVHLDERGVRLAGWDEGWTRTPWDEVLPYVMEGRGWRGLVPEDRDLPLEIARQAALEAGAPTRESALAALRRVAKRARAAEEAHLRDALEHRALDWSPALEEGSFIEADVVVRATPTPGQPDRLDLVVEVTNRDDMPLHQALVELSSSQRPWDGVVVPIGMVPAGAAVTRSAPLSLSPGIAPREDLVTVRLRAPGRPPLLVGEEPLAVSSSPLPVLTVSARLKPHLEGQHRAEVTVHNTAGHPISGVEVAFEYPGDVDVELVDRAAQINVLPGRSERRFDLALRLGPAAPAALPLTVEVASERYGTLLEWDLALPVDGTAVELEAPVVAWRGGAPVLAAVGPVAVPLVVTDESGLDHVVVYVNGTKTAWAGGEGRKRVELATSADLHGRSNRIVVYATDHHGIETTETFIVRGEAAVTVDAGD
ncbi:MAG: C-terminal peptidase prc [Myxococcota bacterium]|jgi:C-terminal peptidase prc